MYSSCLSFASISYLSGLACVPTSFSSSFSLMQRDNISFQREAEIKSKGETKLTHFFLDSGCSILFQQSFSLDHQDEAKLYVTKAKEFLTRLPPKEVNALI